MDVGNLLSLIAVTLLATKIAVWAALLRISHPLRGEPGHRALRILVRTVGIIVIGQGFLTLQALKLDAAPQSLTHLDALLLELAAEVIVLVAFLWALFDLTRPPAEP